MWWKDEEARTALGEFGDVEDATAPGGALVLRTVGLDESFSVYANFRSDGLLVTAEIWRPEDPETVDVEIDGIPVFGPEAETVLQAFAGRGLETDSSDQFYPVIPAGYLSFGREGGEECDDEGLARFMQSVFLAPPGYATDYTGVTLPVV